MLHSLTGDCYETGLDIDDDRSIRWVLEKSLSGRTLISKLR